MKALRISEATMDAVKAFTATTAETGAFGLPAAWGVAALDALQIAKIIAEPKPKGLATGGIASKPIFSRGGNFVAGEAGPEAVIPLDANGLAFFRKAAGMQDDSSFATPKGNRIDVTTQTPTYREFARIERRTAARNTKGGW